MSTKNLELETLKVQADQMNLKYHHKIGVAKLEAMIQQRLAGVGGGDGQVEVEVPQDDKVVVMTKAQRMQIAKKKMSELVRIEITNMNPNKKAWQGELFTAGNSQIGTFRRFVPFGKPWHVERIILNVMKEKKFQYFTKGTDSKGREVQNTSLMNELNIRELPPLTPPELARLAKVQAMASREAD